MRLLSLLGGGGALLVAFARSLVTAQQVNCTLCKDGSTPLDLDTPVFINEGENVTCGQLLESATTRETVDECETIQAEGVSLCGCPLLGGGQNCTLCQDGSSVVDPNLTFVPGFSCGSLEDFVKSDERDGACEAYQATAGVYCNCALEETTPNVCRICGGTTELPDPGLLVPIVDADLDSGHDSGSVRPCSALEFDATFFYDQCSRYQQDYGEVCCGNETIMTSTAMKLQMSLLAVISIAAGAVGWSVCM